MQHRKIFFLRSQFNLPQSLQKTFPIHHGADNRNSLCRKTPSRLRLLLLRLEKWLSARVPPVPYIPAPADPLRGIHGRQIPDHGIPVPVSRPGIKLFQNLLAAYPALMFVRHGLKSPDPLLAVSLRHLLPGLGVSLPIHPQRVQPFHLLLILSPLPLPQRTTVILQSLPPLPLIQLIG